MTPPFWPVCVVLALAGLLLKRREPNYRARPILTPNEREFFGRLTRALPDSYVFPQVAMSALIEPAARGKAYMSDFRRISQKRVDYAIYTHAMKLVAVVELDDRTHNSARDRRRDAMLLGAGIRTVRFQSRIRPDGAAIRAALFPASAATAVSS
jgi:hypothetical protein